MKENLKHTCVALTLVTLSPQPVWPSGAPSPLAPTRVSLMGLLCTFSPCLPAGRSYLDLQDLKSWKLGYTPSRRASVSLQEGLRATD